MATPKRLAILETIADNVKTIRAGDIVGGKILAAYTNTVGHVGFGYIDVTNFSDEEFPVVLIIDDLPTSFEVLGDGIAYDAVWPLAFAIIVKDTENTSQRDTAMASKLETMFRDLDMALHRDEKLYTSADVGLLLKSFDPDPMADPSFGMATAIYEIRYQHQSF